MTSPRFLFVYLLAAVIAAGSGCSTTPVVPRGETVAAAAPRSVLRSVTMDRALEDRILALNPAKISSEDVRDTLSKAPAPRIFLIRGGIYPVYLAMESFGAFLIGMGYPEQRILTPHENDWSLSPYESAPNIAVLLAWSYEHEGVRPTMIGHSQGGIQAVKVLHELAGDWSKDLHPYNPTTNRFQGRRRDVDRLPAATASRGLPARLRRDVARRMGAPSEPLDRPRRVRTIRYGRRVRRLPYRLRSPGARQTFDELKSFPQRNRRRQERVAPADYARHRSGDGDHGARDARGSTRTFHDGPSALAPLPTGEQQRNVRGRRLVWHQEHWAIKPELRAGATGLPPG
jgi:hypothetical protein